MSDYASILARFELGDMDVEYVVETASQAVGLRVLPASTRDREVPRHELVDSHESRLLPEFMLPIRAWRVEPLVQVKLAGDAIEGFAQGATMRNSETLASLRFAGQEVREDGDATEIVTTLRSERGYACEHRLRYRRGDEGLTVETEFRNESSAPLRLELLSSFSLSGMTPFAADDAPERLFLHRFRSWWAAEGRHVCESVDELGLEPSWLRHGVRVERFGQLGSLPVRGWFPFVAVEDRGAGVFWGAQLAWAGSWQLEAYRRGDELTLSGGLADREFGHWTKDVGPGEAFTSPPAFLSTVEGELDDLCHRLTSMQRPAAELAPASEQTLPVLFNEFCTTWGNPSHERLAKLARVLEGSGIEYFVIDAGWYQFEGADWALALGEWIPSPTLFPDGLAATAALIREHGFVPGIWFEFEAVGRDSPLYDAGVEHVLTRDGLPVTAMHRRFWDFRDPWVRDFLREKVFGLLRDAGFGYIKVDYNETIGLGVDGAESLGEGLRAHIAAVQDVFRELREEFPELVIEVCAAGGHRLEPSMLALGSMASFSDAHESLEIPVIAGSLHRLMLPRQSQIWAVLHAADSRGRLVYSLAAGFLGRLCLSGEVDALSAEQWSLVREAIDLYARVAPIIRDGRSRVHARVGSAWQHPEGIQAVVRVSDAGDEALVVVHAFAAPPPAFEVPLPEGEWRIASTFAAAEPAVTLGASGLRVEAQHELEGFVLHLVR